MITNLIKSKSILDRFSISLVAGGLRAIVAFLTAMLLARWFGPEEYGRIVFLLAAHIAIRQFFDMGTSSAFFTFISKKARSHYFVLVYWGWLFFQFSLLALLTVAVIPQELFSVVWQGESRTLVLAALISTFIQGVVWQAAAQMGEAIRETSRVQLIGITALIVHLLLITISWIFGFLSIPLVFLLTSLEWLLASIYIYRLHYISSNYSSVPIEENESFISIFNEYKLYCLPLIPLAWLGAFHDFADRWMLQNWGGAKEQAYFGVASQLAAISLLVTTAILRIFWKEIAEAHEEKNYQRNG